MLTKLRPRSAYDVMAALALFLALSTSAAYAANTVFSTDIVDGQVKTADIGTSEVKTIDLGSQAVSNAKLGADAVTASKVLDYSLTNHDVGVLFAEVNAAGVLQNSSGGPRPAPGVTVSKLPAPSTGNYSVNFGRDIRQCTAVATIGQSSVQSHPLVTGEVSVAERFGVPEALWVDTRTSGGSSADKPFRLVVVC